MRKKRLVLKALPYVFLYVAFFWGLPSLWAIIPPSLPILPFILRLHIVVVIGSIFAIIITTIFILLKSLADRG